MSKTLTVLAILVVIAIAPRRVHAQGSPATPADFGPGVEVTAAVLLAPPLVVNTIHVAEHEHGNTVWPVLGIGAGAVGVALGLAYALPNAGSQDSNASLKQGLGWGLVAEGAANLGIAVWTLTLPRERASPAAMTAQRARWAIGPLVLRDVAGRPADGVALSVQGL